MSGLVGRVVGGRQGVCRSPSRFLFQRSQPINIKLTNGIRYTFLIIIALLFSECKYIKKNKNKKNRMAKSRRYKRSGTGPDLRALTTEQPDAEYIQNPDNGVNAVETKSEL